MRRPVDRAGHDTTQERKRGPIADALVAFVERLAGANKACAKLVGVLKQFSVVVGKVVMLVRRHTLWKTVLSFPILFDVFARALDKMAGQFNALRLRKRGHFIAGKFGAEQCEQ
ncbi:MAG: hypothetical protein ACLQVY_03650 [Limisphaerales bacterium]